MFINLTELTFVNVVQLARPLINLELTLDLLVVYAMVRQSYQKDINLVI